MKKFKVIIEVNTKSRILEQYDDIEAEHHQQAMMICQGRFYEKHGFIDGGRIKIESFEQN